MGVKNMIRNNKLQQGVVIILRLSSHLQKQRFHKTLTNYLLQMN